MDLVYKIYGVYLYDDQVYHEWLIFHKKPELGYWFSKALDKIYNLPKENKNLKSIEIIKKVLSDEKDTFLIKNDNFLTTELVSKVAHNPRYNIYDIYWNETKSGLNATEYNYLSTYREGDSATSCYRIHEEHHNREIVFKPINRDLKIDEILKKAATS